MLPPFKNSPVGQFHLLSLNWNWHSDIAIFKPLITAGKTPGLSRISLLCFFLSGRFIVLNPGSMADDSLVRNSRIELLGSASASLTKDLRGEIVYEKMLGNCSRVPENQDEMTEVADGNRKY